jgi:hypothetical protein
VQIGQNPRLALPCRRARYLYVCEDGLVHWCSQRGRPGIPLDQYGEDDLRREYDRVKDCAPFCTVGCVHRVAQVDELRPIPSARWRAGLLRQVRAKGRQPRLPVSVRVLRWAFVTSARRDLFRSTVAAILGGGR